MGVFVARGNSNRVVVVPYICGGYTSRCCNREAAVTSCISRGAAIGAGSGASIEDGVKCIGIIAWGKQQGDIFEATGTSRRDAGRAATKRGLGPIDYIHLDHCGGGVATDWRVKVAGKGCEVSIRIAEARSVPA